MKREREKNKCSRFPLKEKINCLKCAFSSLPCCSFSLPLKEEKKERKELPFLDVT